MSVVGCKADEFVEKADIVPTRSVVDREADIGDSSAFKVLLVLQENVHPQPRPTPSFGGAFLVQKLA